MIERLKQLRTTDAFLSNGETVRPAPMYIVLNVSEFD